MGDATPLDYWTLAIAIVGAATGLAALAAQVWSFALSGPRIKVSVAASFVPSEEGWLLSLEVVNVGRMPVTLAECGIIFGDDKKIPVGLMREPGLVRHGSSEPQRLPDGESATWVLSPRPLAVEMQQHGQRDARGYVRLATGKFVRSRKSVDVVRLASN